MEETENSSKNINEWAKWIEDGIDKEFINHYNYNEFQDIQPVGYGGFGKVYRANWESSNTVVALKRIENNVKSCVMKEIVNEVY